MANIVRQDDWEPRQNLLRLQEELDQLRRRAARRTRSCLGTLDARCLVAEDWARTCC